MKWFLVYIVVSSQGNSLSIDIGSYDNMIDCFFAREQLTLDLGRVDGHFPHGSQAVCIPTDIKVDK